MRECDDHATDQCCPSFQTDPSMTADMKMGRIHGERPSAISVGLIHRSHNTYFLNGYAKVASAGLARLMGECYTCLNSG